MMNGSAVALSRSLLPSFSLSYIPNLRPAPPLSIINTFQCHHAPTTPPVPSRLAHLPSRNSPQRSYGDRTLTDLVEPDSTHGQPDLNSLVARTNGDSELMERVHMIIDGKSISESVSETQSNAAGLTDMPLSLETKSLETGAALPANASYDRGSELSLGGRVGVAVGASVGTFLIVGLMFAGCNMFYGEINEPVSNAGVRANTLEHPPADVELSPSKPAPEAVGGKGKGKAEQIPRRLSAVSEQEDDDPDKIAVAPHKSEEASLSSVAGGKRPVRDA